MSQDLTYRAATEEDLPKILELAVELVTTSRSLHRTEIGDEEIRGFRRQNFGHLASVFSIPEAGLFVANNKVGEHIGHVLTIGNQNDALNEIPQAWVCDVSVRRDWWGKGVGRKLMACAEEFAQGLGLEYIGLGVTESNERAVGFYRDLGYEIERVQMVKKLEPCPE